MPTVSWVTSTIRQESTKQAAPRYCAWSERRTSVTPRAAATWRKTAITVFVPNSQASSTRGASVSCTSQSGMTTLSSTPWVPSTPLQTLIRKKPRLCIALRRSPECSTAFSTGESSWVASGRRRGAEDPDGVEGEEDRRRQRHGLHDVVAVRGQGDAREPSAPKV